MVTRGTSYVDCEPTIVVGSRIYGHVGSGGSEAIFLRGKYFDLEREYGMMKRRFHVNNPTLGMSTGVGGTPGEVQLEDEGVSNLMRVSKVTFIDGNYMRVRP